MCLLIQKQFNFCKNLKSNFSAKPKIGFIISLIFTFLFINDVQAKNTSQTYLIDKEHTEIGFEVKHLVISRVKGRFDIFQGQIETENDVLTKISGTVDSASVNTNQEKRDKHLRSADFLDTEKFPKLSFEADKLKIKKGEKKKIKSQITIHGVTRAENIEIEFVGTTEDPWGTKKIVIQATAEINRKDYGLTWNQALETGGVMVGEKIKIEVNAQGNLK